MAIDPNSILAITQPTLEIRKISQLDPDKLPGLTGGRVNDASVETTTGFINPYIEIDNYIIQGKKIVSLNINQNGFLPELTLSFIDSTGSFSGMYFPRTNPILKLYIKSPAPAVKPIRSDYLITNITCSELDSVYSERARLEVLYTVSAKLHIPGIYGNTIQSIPKKKSWEALKAIADSLKLGFATNETSTNDEMTWINPNSTAENFIKSICRRAYKDEKSFFDCFIDVNYILNFVNYEKSLSKETKIMQAPLDALMSQSSDKTGISKATSKDNEPKKYDLVDVELNSSAKKSNTGIHIFYYAMQSEHGEILANQSFRKNILWHDRKFYLENKELIKHYVEPLNQQTINFKDAVYQRPKPQTFEKENTIRWVGVDYNNGHTNYKFSRLLNSHNLDELTKNYLVVKIPGVSQLIYRGGKIIVNIKKLASSELNAIEPDEKYTQAESSLEGRNELFEVYLTGPYVVKDIKYEYDATAQIPDLAYTTELTLVRRDWIELGENNKLDSERNLTHQ